LELVKSMIEKRAFHRVPFTAQASFSNNFQTFSGRLENISYGGILVRLEKGPEPVIGDNYTLILDIMKYDIVLQMNVEVAYTSNLQVGLKFSHVDQEDLDKIAILISQIEKRKYSLNSKRNSQHNVEEGIHLAPTT
jgi:c-di-GMP-binding flagellar brake protein YcgR